MIEKKASNSEQTFVLLVVFSLTYIVLCIHILSSFSLNDFLSKHSALNNVLINCLLLLAWFCIGIVSTKTKYAYEYIYTAYIVSKLSG